MNFLPGIRKHRKNKIELPRAPLSAIKTLPFHYVRQASPESHIFIVGPPRAGTTLVFSIIKSHTDLWGLDEETFFFCKKRFDNLHFNHIDKLNLDTIIKESRDKVDVFDKIVSHFKQKFKFKYFVEKTPQHALYISNLIYWFPRSKFIFILRDGRDCFASAKRNPVVWTNHGNMYPYVWRDTVEAFLQVAPHDQIMQLRYEALARAPYETMEQVMRFLNLDFDDYQLDPSAYGATSFSTKTGHLRLNATVSDATVGTWKFSLSKSELDLFEKVCGPHMLQVGYHI